MFQRFLPGSFVVVFKALARLLRPGCLLHFLLHRFEHNHSEISRTHMHIWDLRASVFSSGRLYWLRADYSVRVSTTWRRASEARDRESFPHFSLLVWLQVNIYHSSASPHRQETFLVRMFIERRDV